MSLDAAVVMPWPHDAAPGEAEDHAQPRSTATACWTRAIAAGDTEAFAAFYEAWFDRAYLLAPLSTRRDESFCLDVVQDAMLRVVRSIPHLADPAALDGWMARVVHTTALDRLRAEHRRARREERACKRRGGETESSRIEATIEIAERMAWIEARLAEASDEERALVHGRFAAGRTFQDLGRSLGTTGNAASGRLTRCVARLRALAREAFGDE